MRQGNAGCALTLGLICHAFCQTSDECRHTLNSALPVVFVVVPEGPSVPGVPRLKLLSREQAILEFNRRVLTQAQREDVPLLERLRYICILSSNLDEFFEVRYADILEASKTRGTGIGAQYLADVARNRTNWWKTSTACSTTRWAPAASSRHRHPEPRRAQQPAMEWVAGFFQKQVQPCWCPSGWIPHPSRRSPTKR